MEWQKADNKHPNMGIENKPCKNPKYWCRLHEVWLSEEDVIKKQCKCRPTTDMIAVRKCNNLEEKDYGLWVSKLNPVKTKNR